MRTVLRPLIAVAALVAFAVPSLASAASTAAVPTRHLPASGATIRWTVMVHNANDVPSGRRRPRSQASMEL